MSHAAHFDTVHTPSALLLGMAGLRTVLLTAALVGVSSTAIGARAAPDEDPITGLRMYLEKETTGLGGRVEIVMGTLDERQKLTPCSRIEPFLPAGTKLRGKANIGLRCTDGAGWTAWLPVEIKIWGPALVANGNFTAGQALAEQDVRIEEIDLAREPGAITALAQISDKALTRQLNSGQLLRQDQFRIRPLVSQGDLVQVVYSGHGFSVSTEGQALGQASSGQTLRVKINSGKVLSGVLQSSRIVAISY